MGRIIVFFIGLLVLLTTVFVYISSKFISYEVSYKTESTFYLNKPYDVLKKQLIRSGATEKIIEKQNGKLVDKKITGITIEAPRLVQVRQWTIFAERQLSVITDHDMMKGEILDLREISQIGPAGVKSRVNLVYPVGPLQKYNTEVYFTPESNRTKVEAKVQLTVAHMIFDIQHFRDIVNQETSSATQNSMGKLQNALQEVLGQ